MGFLNGLRRRAGFIASVFDAIGFVWLWFTISLALLFLVALLNPVKLGAYLWFVSKITGAAGLGYCFDVAFFRGSDPKNMEGLEQSMAAARRATLIAATLIAAGLIG